MPTYLNSNAVVTDAEGIRIEAGESVATKQWVAVLPSGVTKTSDSPYYDNIISSAKITGTTTVSVPVTLKGNYKITVYCNTVEVSVKLNSSSAVAKLLGAGETYSITCLSRIVDNIIVTISSGVAYVTIEAI